MKLVKTSRTLGLVALAAIASPCAVADDSGWYAGANVGQSRAKIDDPRIARGLLAGGFTTTSIQDDDHHFGFKLFGGYQFNRYFALEGGYFDLGRFGFTATTVPAGTLRGDIKLKGVNLDGVGILPFTDKFSAFARIGANYAQAKDTFAGTGFVGVANPERSEHATNYKFGAGLEYRFTESFGVRAEAERYRIHDAVGNKGDIDLFSVGLVYRFGRVPPERHEAAPAPVVVAPPPEPVVVAPPPPPPPPALPTRVAFSADSLFDFNKDVVKPAGKRELDKLAADLRGANFAVITVTGYTDRIGSHDYNVRLSTRRAEAVKDYLIESAGIPANKIRAIGADGSDPKTKAGDCPGNKRTPQLIACLQPDRRVEVEVAGTEK